MDVNFEAYINGRSDRAHTYYGISMFQSNSNRRVFLSCKSDCALFYFDAAFAWSKTKNEKRGYCIKKGGMSKGQGARNSDGVKKKRNMVYAILFVSCLCSCPLYHRQSRFHSWPTGGEEVRTSRPPHLGFVLVTHTGQGLSNVILVIEQQFLFFMIRSALAAYHLVKKFSSA